MPYIDQKRRFELDHWRNEPPLTAGELNYVITKLVQDYYKSHERISYGVFNEMMGVLECVKQELYRRAVAPYEDGKIIENGDVY